MSRRAVSNLAIVSFGVAALASAALAGNAAIKQRQDLLKGFGDATKPVAGMMKSRRPFDLALVRTALADYANGSKKLPDLFPADSKTGDKTQAKAAIWDEKDKFNALFKKLNDDSTTGLADITDETTFRSIMPKVLGDCKECHDAYREKDD